MAIGLTVGALAAGIGITAAGPAGAQAPPDAIAPLPARYHQQKPQWQQCPEIQVAAYECATLTVPMDYQRPDGATLKVAVSRLRTSVPGTRASRGPATRSGSGPGTRCSSSRRSPWRSRT